MGDRGPRLIQCAFRLQESPPRTGPRIVRPFLHGAAARQADRHVPSKASTLSPILQRLVETCLDRETVVIRRHSSVLCGPLPPSVVKLSLPIRRLRRDWGTAGTFNNGQLQSYCVYFFVFVVAVNVRSSDNDTGLNDVLVVDKNTFFPINVLFASSVRTDQYQIKWTDITRKTEIDR